MKEDGINKLIELLNDYAKVLGIGNHIGWHNRKTVENSAYIFTKKFGFIKRLVDNDKIDFRKLDPKLNDSIPTRYYLGTYIRYSFEKEILMALSIEDNPIEFLISILK